MLNGESEVIRLCDSEDNETENEIDKKEKLQANEDPFKSVEIMKHVKNLHFDAVFSVHHPEIYTPPPELHLELS